MISIPANFAEGFGKEGKRGKLRFFEVAKGSLEECRYYLRLAKDLDYAETDSLRVDLESICNMLTRFSATIKSSL